MSDLYDSVDKSLYKTGTQDTNSSIPTEQLEFGSGLDPNRTVTADQLIIGGGRQITISPGQSIQKALDIINDAGGGTLRLTIGTFVVNGALNGYPGVSIEGVSPSLTIIDFNSTAANLAYAGTNVYTTGTITSITSGVNVVGSGTSWLTNATAGQYLFIGTRHYKIAVVTDDTHIILAEGYVDNVTMPGAAYRITTAVADISLKNFSVKSSTGTGIAITDGLQMTIDNVQSVLCNKGWVFTNCSRINIDRVLAVANTSNGFEFTNVGQCDWESTIAASNGGHGFVLNNVKTLSALLSSSANTTDGYNATDMDQATLILEASGNGGQGMEMVSGCDDNTIDGLFISNTSDGVKLTATSDRNKLTGIYKSNGGYGINIAASSCDDNIIDTPIFSGNSSGTYSDSGTNTIIIVTLSGTEILSNKTISGDLTLQENASIALDPAGSADGKYTGNTVTGTGGATIAFGDLVTLDKDDSRWELVDISVAAAATGDARGIIGIAVSSSTDGNPIKILLQGIIRADANFPALTIGAAVYASTTGDIVVAQPTTTDYVIRVVGFALTADEIYFNPSNDYITHV